MNKEIILNIICLSLVIIAIIFIFINFKLSVLLFQIGILFHPFIRKIIKNSIEDYKLLQKLDNKGLLE